MSVANAITLSPSTDACSWIPLMLVLRIYGGETGTLRGPNMATTRWGSLKRRNDMDVRRSRRAAFDGASSTQ
jgi:hypothetical protein